MIHSQHPGSVIPYLSHQQVSGGGGDSCLFGVSFPDLVPVSCNPNVSTFTPEICVTSENGYPQGLDI